MFRDGVPAMLLGRKKMRRRKTSKIRDGKKRREKIDAVAFA
jgi:hypothetical protein